MKTKIPMTMSILLAARVASAAESAHFNTDWVTPKPEVLTYQSKSKQGDGLYQVSVSRTQKGIEVYMNIITPGFTKSVWGAMTPEMRPTESKSRIIVSDQISMTTDCAYNPGTLHIATLMAPYNQVAEKTLPNSNTVVDFSQTPLVARALPLQMGASFEFSSLNPRDNSLVPLTIKVVGEETIKGIHCYKVEGSDFEGASTYWVEKTGHHRVVRIEQPAEGRTTELMF